MNAPGENDLGPGLKEISDALGKWKPQWALGLDIAQAILSVAITVILWYLSHRVDTLEASFNRSVSEVELYKNFTQDLVQSSTRDYALIELKHFATDPDLPTDSKVNVTQAVIDLAEVGLNAARDGNDVTAKSAALNSYGLSHVVCDPSLSYRSTQNPGAAPTAAADCQYYQKALFAPAYRAVAQAKPVATPSASPGGSPVPTTGQIPGSITVLPTVRNDLSRLQHAIQAKATVFVQYSTQNSDGSTLGNADGVANALRNLQYVVPESVEGVNVNLTRTSVRYYKPADQDAARRLAFTLQSCLDANPPVVALFNPVTYDVPAGQLEVWLKSPVSPVLHDKCKEN